MIYHSLFDKMGIREQPFEWLFLIDDFLTPENLAVGECGDFFIFNSTKNGN